MTELKQTETRIPVPTWNKQDVNKLDFSLWKSNYLSNVVVTEFFPNSTIAKTKLNMPLLNECNAKQQAANELSTMHVVGDESQKWIQENANYTLMIEIPENEILDKPIIIKFDSASMDVLTDRIAIVAKQNSKATVIIEYTGFLNHAGFTSVFAFNNACVDVIKVQNLNITSSHSDYVVAYAEEFASANITSIELGAEMPNLSLHVALAEKASQTLSRILYLGNGNRKLDISTRVDLIGKESVGNIVAKGILLDNSKKTLRDTINFVAGAVKAKGKETEHVLVLSPTTKNVSVPLLLCGEEDVEGEHAATSGKPPEKVLFYLMSRGLSETEAKKLLAFAAFASVLETLQNNEIKQLVLNKLEEAIAKGVK